MLEGNVCSQGLDTVQGLKTPFPHMDFNVEHTHTHKRAVHILFEYIFVTYFFRNDCSLAAETNDHCLHWASSNLISE